MPSLVSSSLSLRVVRSRRLAPVHHGVDAREAAIDRVARLVDDLARALLDGAVRVVECGELHELVARPEVDRLHHRHRPGVLQARELPDVHLLAARGASRVALVVERGAERVVAPVQDTEAAAVVVALVAHRRLDARGFGAHRVVVAHEACADFGRVAVDARHLRSVVARVGHDIGGCAVGVAEVVRARHALDALVALVGSPAHVHAGERKDNEDETSEGITRLRMKGL